MAKRQPQKKDASKEAPVQKLEDGTRIQKLLSGEVEPPNDFVKYLVEKMRKSRAQYQQLEAEISRMKQMLTQAEQQILVVQGEHNSCIEDIKQWDKELADDEKEEPAEQAAG